MNDLLNIENKILVIRGQQVMLDRDLAGLYGVETRIINQAVKRNFERFPEEFCFKLTWDEIQNLKSHFVISSWGGTRFTPYAFTEQGVAMLSAILRSEVARLSRCNFFTSIMQTEGKKGGRVYLPYAFTRLEETQNIIQDIFNRL